MKVHSPPTLPSLYLYHEGTLPSDSPLFVITKEHRVDESMEEEVALIETETRMEEDVVMEVDRFLAAMKGMSLLEEMEEEEHPDVRS